MTRGVRARVAAARAIARVTADGVSLSESLPPFLSPLGDARDRALAQAVAYGVLRFLPRLELLLDALTERPPRRRDSTLRALLLSGLYQIGYMDIPDHAAVSATVSGVRAIGRPGARGFANAVLRRYLREREQIDAVAATTEAGRFAYPQWIIERLRRDWRDDWQAILAAGNEQPPMWIRVNRLRMDRDAWANLADAPATRPGEWAPESLRLVEAVDVERLPGFADGLVSVQDAGAQLAARLIAPRPGERVLDACAAPGGKTCHLLELCPQLELTALDISAPRIERVRENLQRLGLSARLVNGDAARPDSWWDGRRFDAVLLDAPCSASGVIRRHPDIKCLRRETDVERLVATQARLLEGLWPLLRPGGRLVYCTCSVFQAEGSRQVDAFVTRTADATAADAERLGQWGRPGRPGRQILPGEAAMDGFYYACLTKSGERS